MRQKTELEMAFRTTATGEPRSLGPEGTETGTATSQLESPAAGWPLMEAIVERDNLRKALAQVKRNKGAAGVDGMTVDELASYLRDHWPTIRIQLLDGTYRPQPVLRVEIPKVRAARPLGIPTVLDRFIQQAVLQVLQPGWDRTFSDAALAFGRSDRLIRRWHERKTISRKGHDVVVDIDLEKFFDRVNHDILMGLVAKRVGDQRLLRLIRGFLSAGVLADGLVGPTDEGTPQGGPLSPLLSNLMLDVLDKELARVAYLRALRGRLQHLRAQSAGRRAGHGERHPFRDHASSFG